MENIIIIIPAFNPLQSLIHFIDKLLNVKVKKVIVVNDGSYGKYEPIFHEISLKANCIILKHNENIGKGQALKTAINYVLKNDRNIDGVLTAGAHDQHKIADIQLLIETKDLFSDGIIIGTRQFLSKDLPPGSFIGNRATSILFEILFHRRLLDIQSGLRYIPKKELFWLRHVHGKKFSYDTNMLVEAIKRKVPIYEVPIGYARLKKNSIIQYDEIMNTKIILSQIWQSFKKNKLN